MISRAEKIDGSCKVSGYYAKRTDGLDLIYSIKKAGLFDAVEYSWFEVINPSTLEHSFDNGASWYSEDELHDALIIWDRHLKEL